MPATLYEQDFYRWTQEQAQALRAHAAERGANLPVDWENVAEEIESLGQSDRREVVSRLRRVMEHLLKLEHSAAREPRAGWGAIVTRQRLEIEDVLNASPSLRRELPDLAAQAMRGAIRLASDSLAENGEPEAARRVEAAGAAYTADQLLGDWFPESVQGHRT